MHTGHGINWELIRRNAVKQLRLILYFKNSDIKQIQIKMCAHAYTNVYTCTHIRIHSFNYIQTHNHS